MLPEALSTQATSLLEAQDNLSVVVEFVVAADGAVQSSDVYRAVVRNKAQLTYDAVGAWLEQAAPAPPKVEASPELQAQLQLQDAAAQALRHADAEEAERTHLLQRRAGERRLAIPLGGMRRDPLAHERAHRVADLLLFGRQQHGFTSRRASGACADARRRAPPG